MKFDFLICSERSGSNLITKLIDNHPEYDGPIPPHLLRVFNKNLSKYNDLNIDENWHRFIKDILDFFNCKIGIWESEFSFKELIKIEPRNLTEVVQYIYKKEAEKHNKKKSFIKEVKTYRFFDFLKKEFNFSQYIWLVRDPRDMALSWSKSPVHRGDIVRAANIWKEDQLNTIKLYNKLLSENIIYLVKYEILITEQIKTLHSICNFLNIDFEASMMEFHKNKLSKNNASKTDNWKNLGKEIIVTNHKKYLKGLSKKQIQYIEYLCKDEMQFLGYQPDFNIITKSEFKKIEKELSKEERHEKPEYLLIDKTEKIKRTKWYKMYIEITQK